MVARVLTSDLKYMAMGFCGFTAWTLIDAMIRGLNAYPTHQIVFFTTAGSLFLLLTLSSKLGGVRATLRLPKLKMILLRSAVLSVSSFLGYITFAHFDLATAYSMIFTAPLLAKIMSVMLLKERISIRSWLVTVLGFIGVLIVLRPGFDGIPLSWPLLAALSLPLFFALGYVMGRVIGPSHQTLLSLSVFNSCFLFMVTVVPTVLYFTPMALHEYGMLFVMSIFGVLGSLLVASAFNNAPSATIAPLHYTQIVWGVIWGIVFFGEYPDIWTIIGGGVVVIAGLLLIRFSKQA